MTPTTPLWLLDTNVLSQVIRRPHAPLAQRLSALSEQHPNALVTSVVVQCELIFGAQRVGSSRLADRIAELTQLIPVLPLDADVVPAYARLRTLLERAGTPIGPNDMLIAAHALALGCTLVTADAEFDRVPDLRVENWAADSNSTYK